MNKYKIIQRNQLYQKDSQSLHYSVFPDRNYNVPLCGISNYINDIQINDYVSIILKSKTRVNTNFIPNSKGICNTISTYNGSYYPMEEHFFQVIKVKKHEISLKKVYIDNKILLHEGMNSFEKSIQINKNELEKNEICKIWTNFNHNIIQIDKKWFHQHKELEDFYISYNMRHKIMDGFNNNNYTKDILLLIKHYTEYYFDNDILNDSFFYEYYELLEKNKNEIIKHIDIHLIENQGSIELIKKHLENKTNEMFEILPENIVLNIDYEYNYSNELKEPLIKHNITKIDKQNIYRVIKRDKKIYMKKTTQICDWSGKIIPNEIRYMLDEGGIVRMMIYEEKEDDNEEKYLIYFELLKKLNENIFLAIVYNCYMLDYEKALLEIDMRCISEIPISWQKNKDILNEYIDNHKNIEEEEEKFELTGFQAVINENDTEKIPINCTIDVILH